MHLILPPILSGDIETIGVSCPKLKSFSFNKIVSENRLLDFLEGLTPPSNVDAAAIAKNMPNLCHLGILGNELNNEGLEAILDGCPCLQSLDLRCCFFLDLRGALGQRCRAKIKYLRLPFDSVGDYEWKDAVESSDYIPVGNVSRDVDFSFGCYGYVCSEFDHGSASASAGGVACFDSGSDSVCSDADGSAASVCSEVDSDNGSGSVCSEVDFDNSSGSVCSEVDSDNGSGSVCSEVDTDNGLSCSGEVVCERSGLILHDFEQREDSSPLFDSVGEVAFDNSSGSVCSEVDTDNGLEGGLNLHDFEQREDPSPRFDSGGDYYWSGRCDFDDDLGLGNDYNDNFECGNNYDDEWSDY